MLNLDTHILLFALEGSLKPAEQTLLKSEPWGVSAIVLWELSEPAQLGRIAVGRFVESPRSSTSPVILLMRSSRPPVHPSRSPRYQGYEDQKI